MCAFIANVLTCQRPLCANEMDVVRPSTDPDLIHEKCVERADGFHDAIALFPAGHTPKKLQPQLSGPSDGIGTDARFPYKGWHRDMEAHQ